MKYIRDVRAVIYEPDRDLRSAVRGMMNEIGFVEILDTDRPNRVQEAIESAEVDLALFDVNGGTGTMSSLVRDMRHNKIGPNPFPVVLGVTVDADQKSINTAVNAGFDGLTLKPLDLKNLRKRLEYFLRARKPFVITADYVGPDRRQESRPGETSAPLLVAPNPARLIADGIPRDIMMSHIKKATAQLNERKLQRDISGACWAAEQINKALAAEDLDKVSALIQQVKTLAHEIDARLAHTVFSHVRDLCDSLLKVSARLEAAGNEPSGKDVALLVNVSQAIKHGCDTDADDQGYDPKTSESQWAKA